MKRPIVQFEYFVKAAINRLFRFDPRTGRQERWDNNACIWVNVAPDLADDIYSGRVEVDEISADAAENSYLSAFVVLPTTANEAITDDNTTIGENMMIRIEMYVALKRSIEEFVSDKEIVEPELSGVKRYWLALEKEISER
jgi:hypothetical protein